MMTGMLVRGSVLPSSRGGPACALLTGLRHPCGARPPRPHRVQPEPASACRWQGNCSWVSPGDPQTTLEMVGVFGEGRVTRGAKQPPGRLVKRCLSARRWQSRSPRCSPQPPAPTRLWAQQSGLWRLLCRFVPECVARGSPRP